MMTKINYHKPSLNENTFRKISEFIISNFGINISDNKKELLEYRLSKRLTALNFSSFDQYVDYLFSEKGILQEPGFLINEVSTNKTDFFREPKHFKVLINKILPEISGIYKSGILPIWSAGCSSGEEAYTLAICLQNYRSAHGGPDYHIFGSDISQTVLSRAVRAIYPMSNSLPINQNDLKRFFLRSRDNVSSKIRVVKELRDKVDFEYLNLMENEYKTPDIYPVIFCRNTLFYFENNTKSEIVRKLMTRLKPGGYLFISHTESLINMNMELKLIYPSVYQKKG
ncbi:MAG: protein-glutamate O-methyltransferase CheR [Bacteroidota bacterium]|nr:protein-glutamate O-methyltransferase CheR [Bacteroidota bacterium]